MMKPVFTPPNQPEPVDNLKIPLGIIRSHSEYLLEAYDRLSGPQRLTLLRAIQLQAILLEHLLDEMDRP